MKLRYAPLAIAIALGTASVVGVLLPAAAVAADKPQAQQIKLTEAVRKPLAAAQAAVAAKDAPTALAKAAEALAAVQTPEDRYWASFIQYQAAVLAKDNGVQLSALQGMIESGKADPTIQPKLYVAVAQLAMDLKDLPKAEAMLDQGLKLSPSPEVYVYAAETKYKLKKPLEAVRLIAEVSDKAEASGSTVPEDWLKRGVAFAVDAKSAPDVVKLTQSWVRNYPKQTNWRDSLEIYRLVTTLESDYNLDMMRLQRVAGALRGERDYFELAEATYVKLPNEAKSLIDQGIAAGALDPAKSRVVAEVRNIAAGKVAADKASLSKNAANARAALGMADAYASYGDYSSAIMMYRKTLTLPGADANMVNTRLGAALFQSGDKEEAKKVFASITGPRAVLAGYWLILVDHPPVAN